MLFKITGFVFLLLTGLAEVGVWSAPSVVTGIFAIIASIALLGGF